MNDVHSTCGVEIIVASSKNPRRSPQFRTSSCVGISTFYTYFVPIPTHRFQIPPSSLPFIPFSTQPLRQRSVPDPGSCLRRSLLGFVNPSFARVIYKRPLYEKTRRITYHERSNAATVIFLRVVLQDTWYRK